MTIYCVPDSGTRLIVEEKFDYENDFGVSWDEREGDMLTHTLHMSVLNNGHEALVLYWYPAGAYDEDHPFYKAFPKMRSHDEPFVNDSLTLWRNWEAAF